MADGVVVNRNQYSVDNNDSKDNIDKNLTQLESLMEKLRSRKQHQSSWIVLHTSLSSEKKLSNLEYLQKQVVLLQNTIKVTSLMYLVERLEVISNQVGLKFTASDSSFTDLQMSSVMFVVRLLLTPDGGVRDVQISHSSDARASTSCLEMSESVKAGKFDELKRHLEGLAALYDVDGDKKLKQLMFRAVQSLETDLNTLNRPSCNVNVAGYVHKTPLGLLSARAGGLPMKMTYFVGPYDLLNHKTHSSTPMTIEAILENNIGYSVTVGIERSTPHRLQTASSIKTYDNKSTVSNANGNCAVLPAVFVLNLQSPMALSVGIIDKLRQIPGVESVESGTSRALAALLVEHMMDISVRDSDAWEKYSLVTLHGPSFHRYFLLTSDDVQVSQCLQASLVTKIQFTQPSCVPLVISLLRQQALFNTLLSSCLRPSCSAQDPLKHCAKIVCFDVTPISHQHISVMFEHPYRQSLTIVELDLSDIANVRCRMTSSTASDSMCTDEYASKIFQRSLSLPVTFRAILRKAADELSKRPYRPPTPVTSLMPVNMYPTVSLSRRLSTTAPVDVISTRSVTVMLQPITTRTVVAQSSTVTLPVAAAASHSSRGQGNPMLASLLDPEFSNRVSSPTTELSGDRSRGKRASDNLSTAPSKRRPSSDEMALPFSSPSVMMRQAVTTRSVTIPVARSFSVPSQSVMSCRPSIKLEPPTSLPPSASKSTTVAQLAQLVIKQETNRSLADVKHEIKPLITPHQRTNSNSELINLLSADDFDIQRNGDAGSNQDCRTAGGQYDGSCDRSTSQFRAPSRSVSSSGFNGSGSGATSTSSTTGGGFPGGNSAVIGVCKQNITESWESSGNSDSMNWQMSPSANGDEMRPRSATPKNNHIGHLMNVTNNVVIKSEMIACDDVMSANAVTTDSKPPITVKFKRRLVKATSQRRGTPQSDSALDRAAWKERVKQSLKAHPSVCESSPGEALDFEVDDLTSGVRDVSPVSPSQCSSSPRLPSGNALVVDRLKVGEKRQRVMNKAGRLPAEKKQRKDDGRKLSRKIYEFDDDGDVFNSAAPVEKISTIKITKSDGRLQIQNPPRSSSVVGASATRPMQPMHKSSNPGLPGTSHNSSGQKLNRSLSHPVRPSIRPKSTTSPRSDAKTAATSAIVRPKQLPGTPSSDVAGVPQISSTVTKTVGSSSKPAQSSGSISGSSTKTKVIASGSVKKSSLNAVIDKLTKSATSGTEPAGKELYDQIRLEIIREGNKPSTPTRDLSSVKISSSVTTKRPDTPKDATVSRPSIPVRKPVVTTSIPITSVCADPPKSVVRFTVPPASPPSVTAARVCDTVSVVVPRIPRDQLQLTVDRVPTSAVTGTASRSPLLTVRPPDPPGASGEIGAGFRAFVGPRPPRPPNNSINLVSPTFEGPRYRMPEMTVRLSSHESVSRSSEIPLLMADSMSRFALDDSADRLSTRHFMDVMTHSNADGTSVNGTTTPQTVDRHMSPPRSPSPTPLIAQPVPNTMSTDVIGEGDNSLKWTAKPNQQNVLETSPDQTKALISSSNSRARAGPEFALELTVKKPNQVLTVGKDWSSATTVNKIDNNADERKQQSDEINDVLVSSESSVTRDSPVAKRNELSCDRKRPTSLVRTTIQSPHSAASSPDTSLIIDCYPGTPVVPMPAASIASPPPQANTSAIVDPVLSPAAKSSPSCVIVDVDDGRSSPSHNGEAVNRELLSPGGASDGCPATNGDIDDDLMNEALIL